MLIVTLRGLADPGGRHLKTAAVTLTAVLLSFASALLLKQLAGLTTSSVVLAVVLALTIGRTQHGAGMRARLLAVVTLPLVAVAGAEIGVRMFTRPDLGDTLFTLGLAGATWLRRFGPRASRIGTLATSVLVATLITPGPIVPVGQDQSSPWWAAVIATVVIIWVTAVQLLARRLRLVPPKTHEHAAAPAPPPGNRRLRASDRMAIQMAAVLGSSFVLGRNIFGEHWSWMVLTGFIVCSGNRGRGDVVHKAGLRILGASVGTLAATAIAGVFPAGDDWSIVSIFVILAVALWLRPLSYAYWATGMTAAIALLYGYYGERGNHLLATRLEAILLGAAIGVLVSSFLLPVRAVDAVRRQLGIALKTLSDSLGAEPGESLPGSEFHTATAAADRAATSLHLQRVLPARWRTGLPYAAASRVLAQHAAPIAALPQRFHALEPADRKALRIDVGRARKALSATSTDDEKRALAPAVNRVASTAVTLAENPDHGQDD